MRGNQEARMRRGVLTAGVLGALLALVGALPGAGEGPEKWSQFRGPVAAGYELRGALPEGAFGLARVWGIELGSGYSNISISGGRAVTLFTAGEVDVVAAFDAGTGAELWRYEIGEKYAGHDGSDDGPLSTPAIVGDTVYALGPFGRLVALSLSDGSEKWRHDLTEEDSTPPFYGYTTSPVVADGKVFLLTGGDGRAVTAFDAAGGEVLWTAGDGAVTYQTPSLVETGDGALLLAVTDKNLLAIDPESGEVSWQIQHTEGNQSQESAHVVAVDQERFLVNFNDGSKLYRLAEGGPEEVWSSRAFANSLAVPVRVGGHFYGFTGRILTCASVETGEIVWRSRPPGGNGLTVVDGVLAILAPDGDLVLVEATPEGYRERTRISALEAGDYAIASFSDGVFLVRNLDGMAALSVDEGAEPQIAEVDPADRLKGSFGQWVAQVEALPEGERAAAVDAYLAEIEELPIVEDDGWTHFLYRGEARDVGLNGSMLGQGEEVGLYRIAGTDLFFRSFELDSKAQYTYNLVVDYGRPQQDPENPHSVDNGFLVASELRMPDWPASPHLEEPAADAERGELDQFPFRSEILDNTREIKVWRPAGYGRDPEKRYPVLVVNHGDNLLRGGLMRNTLDNLVGESVAPLVAVFVPRVASPEYGGPQVDDYLRFLQEELLPHIDRHYLTDGERRAIMGPGSAGVTAVYAALARPDVFQRAAVQSFYPIEPAQERIPELIDGLEAKPEAIYVVWSRHDYDFDPARRADDASKALVEKLREGGVEVREQIADYTPGWGGWRGQHDEVLAALFPVE